MSDTIVQIADLILTIDNSTDETYGRLDVTLQIIQSDMTYEEVSQARRDGRRYKLVEVFDT